MKILWVGDPHVTPDELEDCQALMDYVLDIASLHKPDFIFFAGDLHHTHSVVRLEVSDFWSRNFAKMVPVCPVKILVGNHDKPSDTEKHFNALSQYKDTVEVIEKPTEINGCVFIPYTKSEVDFKASTQKYPTVFCHQTFQGAAYENGMFAPDGFSLDGIESKIISGHIHSRQSFGNVWYPGAPRWRSVSDAKCQNRAIYILTLDKGVFVSAEEFPTLGICKSVYEIREEEGKEQTASSVCNSVPIVYLTGNKNWTENRAGYWRSFGARISSSVVSKEVQIRESFGVLEGMMKYCSEIDPKFGSDKTVLTDLIRSRFDGFSR